MPNAMTTTDELKLRARRAMVAHAFYRLESALTIALTILLAFFMPRPFDWWRWWFWIILGVAAEALIVYTSLTDARTGQQVVAALLHERYDPGTVKTRAYRDKVRQALTYRDQIEEIVSQMPGGVLRDHLLDSTAGIADWIGNIFAIARRLDVYERDALLHEDMARVPGDVAQLEKALARETDPQVRRQIEATLKAKQGQLDNLRALENRMEQASFRLEETLTSLGTVYSQYQLIRAQRMDSAGARHLSDDISGQVQRLQDLLTSMDEVYQRTP